MTQDSDPPPDPRPLVQGAPTPTLPADVTKYADFREAEDRSRLAETVRTAWGTQHEQDRALRVRFAKWLLASMLVQATVVNAAFFLLGRHWIQVDPWTARTFITAVFGELAAMVFFIVKYLFRSTADDVLKLIGPADHVRPPRKRKRRR